ncbi:hypothetical protein CBP34_10735 [Acidovorax carolinensis]|uniref:Uncharacterized protein n=1 Tax=Acidovorax carolinensis TaxID=553814 RepID=A0A240U3R2_9BURK|nr:hypothetical protein [Acidovorax carolinensis]ART52031.1 hypothetical protein CBP34_10735 [Acidovorax carolinensis]
MKTPVLTPETLYQHPDGYAIEYAQNALIATDADNFVIVPIGKRNLLELSRKLYDIAQRMKD